MRTNSVAAIAAIAFLVVLAAGCRGNGDDDGDSSAPTSVFGFEVTLAGEEQLAFGPSRFVFALQDTRGQPVANARAHLKFFFIDPNADDRKTFKTEVDAEPVTLARAYSLTRPDGSEVTHEGGETGIYARQVAFDAPGEWIVEITGTSASGNLGVIEKSFTVQETQPGPAPGKTAPASTPAIEAALSVGRPTVITFASPGLCPSTVCGPMAEIAADLEEDYADVASFVHVEPFGTDALAEESPQPLEWVTDDWAVSSEAAVFVIDGDGIVRARLDVIVSYDELEAALLAVLS